MLTHERIEYCKTAIESFLSQSYENKELIIVNSGGLKYFELVENFIDYQNVDNIRHVFFLKNQQTTIGELRNKGLEHALGDYITVWDDDDFYSKTRVESQVYWIEKEKADFVMFKNFIVSIKNRTRISCKNPNGLEPSLFFKKNHVLYPKLMKSEDTLFIQQMIDKGFKKYIIDNCEKDYIYNFHGSNTCSHAHFMSIINHWGKK